MKLHHSPLHSGEGAGVRSEKSLIFYVHHCLLPIAYCLLAKV